MTNQIFSMETQLIPVVEDATVLPTNPQQEIQKHSLEGTLVSIEVEGATHGYDQGVKCRCTSRPLKTFAYLFENGYTSDEVREMLNADLMIEEDNVVHTT